MNQPITNSSPYPSQIVDSSFWINVYKYPSLPLNKNPINGSCVEDYAELNATYGLSDIYDSLYSYKELIADSLQEKDYDYLEGNKNWKKEYEKQRQEAARKHIKNIPEFEKIKLNPCLIFGSSSYIPRPRLNPVKPRNEKCDRIIKTKGEFYPH